MLTIGMFRSGRLVAEDLALRVVVTMTGTATYLNPDAPGHAVVRGDDRVVQGVRETAPGHEVEPDTRSLIRLESFPRYSPPTFRQRLPRRNASVSQSR